MRTLLSSDTCLLVLVNCLEISPGKWSSRARFLATFYFAISHTFVHHFVWLNRKQFKSWKVCLSQLEKNHLNHRNWWKSLSKRFSRETIPVLFQDAEEEEKTCIENWLFNNFTYKESFSSGISKYCNIFAIQNMFIDRAQSLYAESKRTKETF